MWISPPQLYNHHDINLLTTVNFTTKTTASRQPRPERWTMSPKLSPHLHGRQGWVDVAFFGGVRWGEVRLLVQTDADIFPWNSGSWFEYLFWVMVFKYLLCSPLLTGEIIKFDQYFSNGLKQPTSIVIFGTGTIRSSDLILTKVV